MTLERACRVVAVDAGGCRLQPLGESCRGCTGCGGRCALIGGNHDTLFVESTQIDGALAVGDSALLSIDAAELRREALHGYGMPLLGLLGGGVLGRACAEALPLPVDPTTAMVALLGTLVGLRVSNRRSAPACRARPIDGP